MDKPRKSMEEVIRTDGRYPPEAYAFLHEGLRRAVREVYGEKTAIGQKHVSGQQICRAMRDLAIELWGMLARTVLAKWNVNATIDFGNMVYLLIEHDYFRKDEADSIEDFRDVYDFVEAFSVVEEFEIKE